MKNKKVLSFVMAGLMIGCVLSGCGGNETADVSTEPALETEKTDNIQKSEENELEEVGTEGKEEVSEIVTIQATTPYAFSEGYAWVRTETPNQLAVVDKDGNIKFTLDNASEGIKVSSNDAANGITYDPIEATPFYDGASVVFPSRELDAYGYAIFDTNGELLASSEDGDDATDIKFLAGGEGKYLIAKSTSGFSDNSTVFYCIDKNGNMISDEIVIPANFWERGWKYIGDGNFASGTHGIIDGKYIKLDSDGVHEIYENADIDTVKNYVVKLLGSEDLIPLCYCGGGNSTYMNVEVVLGSLYYATNFADEYNDLLQKNHEGEFEGWYNKDFELVVSVPEYPEGVEVVELGQFKDGYAPIELMGADGKYYFTLVDKSGNQVYEPVGGVNRVESFNSWSCHVFDGNIVFVGNDTSGRTYYLIDKAGKLYNIAEDISAFEGEIQADLDYESYYVSIAEGFKYIPDGSLLYRKLDGTALENATCGDDVKNVQFTQAYKKN